MKSQLFLFLLLSTTCLASPELDRHRGTTQQVARRPRPRVPPKNDVPGPFSIETLFRKKGNGVAPRQYGNVISSPYVPNIASESDAVPDVPNVPNVAPDNEEISAENEEVTIKNEDFDPENEPVPPENDDIPRPFVPHNLPDIKKGTSGTDMVRFEFVLKGHGMNIDRHWHRLILMVVHPIAASWIDRNLNPTLPWTEASEQISLYIEEENEEVALENEGVAPENEQVPPENDVIPRPFVPHNLPDIKRGTSGTDMIRFEFVLKGHGMNIDRHWHRLILMVVHPIVAVWIDRDLSGKTWTEASNQISLYIEGKDATLSTWGRQPAAVGTRID